MVRLAGEIADGVIFNFFPPARIKEALGEIAEGAQKAGRNPERDRADNVRNGLYLGRPGAGAEARA